MSFWRGYGIKKNLAPLPPFFFTWLQCSCTTLWSKIGIFTCSKMGNAQIHIIACLPILLYRNVRVSNVRFKFSKVLPHFWRSEDTIKRIFFGCGTTIDLCHALLKNSILLHKRIPFIFLSQYYSYWTKFLSVLQLLLSIENFQKDVTGKWKLLILFIPFLPNIFFKANISWEFDFEIFKRVWMFFVNLFMICYPWIQKNM